MDLIGYVTFYYKLYLNGAFKDYIEYTSDFSTPLTEEVLEDLRKIIIETFEKMFNGNVELRYTTKEEYDNYLSTNKGKRLSYSWDENNHKLEEI